MEAGPVLNQLASAMTIKFGMTIVFGGQDCDRMGLSLAVPSSVKAVPIQRESFVFALPTPFAQPVPPVQALAAP